MVTDDIPGLNAMKNIEEPSAFVSHKFIPLDKHRWASLESSRFYFSSPESLNDPADCQIDLQKAFYIARKELDATNDIRHEHVFMSFVEETQKTAKTIGVFSLCSGNIDGEEERLMWAHYASNHAGVCLTFEIPCDFIRRRLVGCAPVRYNSDALLVALRRVDLDRKLEFEPDIKPILTGLITTKSPEWAYEKEARLISYKPGLVSFERNWLKQICFGLRTSSSDRMRIEKLLSKYPACALAEIYCKDSELFGFGVRDIV